MFNLLTDSWIPVSRQSGKQEYISPNGITAHYTDDPIVALNAPRPDFNGALVQFLVGIVQTACPPANESEWRRQFANPPSPDDLKKAFGQFTHAFNLDGDGPRFMQDLELDEKTGELNQIDHLLMEMPGAQTLDKNTDHFLKRDTVKRICPRCCAMALLTLQTNAPSGGRGHRTSIRGGGPLTTLVIGRNLWETIWLNVLTKDVFLRYGNADKKNDSDIFPWMGPTRTSEKKGQETTSQHVHPLQLYWGMPRRIRLESGRSPEKKPCDLCESTESDLTAQYRDKSYGINYKGAWRHPLTPYFVDEKSGEYQPKHGQSGGISYRNWLGLVQNITEKKYRAEPAVVIHTFRQERQDALSGKNEIPFRLWAFGYDMDNMKACGWYEGTMPLIHLEPNLRPEYGLVVSQMIKTASLIASDVRLCLKKALFSPNSEVSLGKSFFETVDSRFWQETEPQFYQTLTDLKNALETRQPLDDIKLRWLAIISSEGERLFDYYSQSNQISSVSPRRIALARRDFRMFSSKSNKKIVELLDLPKPEKTVSLKSRSASKKKT